MKIRSTFKVTIASADGDAKAEFRKPKRNEMLRREAENKEAAKTNADYFKETVAPALVAVENFTDDDGKALTVDDVRDCSDDVVISALCHAYVYGLKQLNERAADEKNYSAVG